MNRLVQRIAAGARSRKTLKAESATQLSMSSISMLVFAGYLFCMHVVFVLFPDIVLPTLGFDAPEEVWVRILGYVVGSVAFYHYMAVRQNVKQFYWWSVYARLPILPTFAILVWMGKGPVTILAMGTFDTICALWTWFALKKERVDSV